MCYCVLIFASLSACASSFIGQQTCRACALGNCAEEVNREADRPAGVTPTRLGWKLREAWRRRGRAGSKLVRRKGPAGPGREAASLTLTSSSSSRLSDRELRLTCALNRSQSLSLFAKLTVVLLLENLDSFSAKDTGVHNFWTILVVAPPHYQ